jgi:hypothetical protein
MTSEHQTIAVNFADKKNAPRQKNQAWGDALYRETVREFV